jgi:hypothetical protein
MGIIFDCHLVYPILAVYAYCVCRYQEKKKREERKEISLVLEIIPFSLFILFVIFSLFNFPYCNYFFILEHCKDIVFCVDDQ